MISAYCKVCRAALSRSDMERYLRLCETAGKAPKTEGAILCWACTWRTMAELAEDEPEGKGGELVRAFRRGYLGIRRVK